MAASRPALEIARESSTLTGRRMRWLGGAAAGAGTILALVLLGWLIFWIRDELAVEASARAARDLIAAGQFPAASAPLEHWLKARPKSPEARFLSARAAIGLERFEQGFRELQAAYQLGYAATAIERQRAIVLSRLGKHAEAEPVLRRIFLAPADDGSRDAEVDEALARSYIETFQLRAAEEVIKRWMQDAPSDAKAYFWKSEVEQHKAHADAELMVANYEHALQLDPELDKARLALAELYLKAHRIEDAAREYSIYLSRHPDHFAACLGLGQIAAERGNDEEAIGYFDRASKLAPRDFRPLFERGKMEIARGRTEAALAFFDKAVEMNADEPEVHYQRSLILTRLGRTSDAKKDNEETARLRKQKDELSKLLDRLLITPNDERLQYDAARWLFDHGHPEEGLRWAEKNLRDHPRHIETIRLLADYYEKQGNEGLANFYRVQVETR
jgi:tetratricopeptide (TPR) repeat protein